MELSFLLGVHQDGLPEEDEFFDILLEEAWGGARLGSQQRTRITIVDADRNGTTTDYAQTIAAGADDEAADYGLTDYDDDPTDWFEQASLAVSG